MPRRVLICLLALLACLRAAGAETILVISDTHFTGEAQARAAVTGAVQRAAETRGVLLLLGDNTNNSRPEEHEAVLAFARSAAGGGTQVLLLPGNHDYTRHWGPAEFAAQYGAYGAEQAFSRDAATAGCAVMTGDGTCLLLLDTNARDANGMVLPDGGVTRETLAWAESVLDALPPGTPVIACGHHPILPASRGARTPGAGALADALRAHGVRLYLCGHDHGFATVEERGLRQITVGQPQGWPGWAGEVERTEDGFLWRTECVYEPSSPVFQRLRNSAEALARQMAAGTLASTAFAEDEGAIRWFCEAFMHHAGGTLTPEICARLLADENCAKWREIETRTVVRDWILGLLENCPEDVRSIRIPLP